MSREWKWVEWNWGLMWNDCVLGQGLRNRCWKSSLLQNHIWTIEVVVDGCDWVVGLPVEKLTVVVSSDPSGPVVVSGCDVGRGCNPIVPAGQSWVVSGCNVGCGCDPTVPAGQSWVVSGSNVGCGCDVDLISSCRNGVIGGQLCQSNCTSRAILRYCNVDPPVYFHLN